MTNGEQDLSYADRKQLEQSDVEPVLIKKDKRVVGIGCWYLMEQTSCETVYHFVYEQKTQSSGDVLSGGTTH